jgi:alkanesulfonate monooxygenase SsuD/methylene tetrahydromethanopterin reductase-like flavin-dependent oxidoreductase (luciferase family)
MMKLGYFAMPAHPASRNITDTLREDREIVILADQLGYHDAFIGEHLTDLVENVTNSMLFLATLIHSTKQIKLGTGTTNLAHQHPVLVAAHAAMFDHLAEGRFILGLSQGALPSDAEVLGLLDQPRKKIFSESLDVILKIWQTEPPYNIDLPDNRFKVTTEKTLDDFSNTGKMYKPYQRPYPELVGTVVEPYSHGAVLMGQKDIHPISANFLFDDWLESHWEQYSLGKTSVGKVADRSEWRIARTIIVNDDDKVAHEYGKISDQSPYKFYYRNLAYKLLKGRPGTMFVKKNATGKTTFNDILDELVICGSVDSVVDQILALHDKTGGFGELLYAGIDWVDPNIARRSMVLMAEEVMPRVNAALK